MMHGNGSPLGIRKTVRLMVILTILAWATQTLLAQWGFSAEQQAGSTPVLRESPHEVFVPADRTVGGTLELRSEAIVPGADVTLKQICRWGDRDSATFAPIADLKLLALSPKTTFQSIGLAEVKSLLHDAGVSLGNINFTGAASCTVSRSDAVVDELTALQQWIDAKRGNAVTESTAAVLANQPESALHENARRDLRELDGAAEPVLASSGPTEDPAAPMAPGGPSKEFRTLRQVLIADLGARLGENADDLQMHFGIKDEKVLALSEPHFRFQVEPTRARSLGNVNWDVTIIADDGAQQRLNLSATARLWQDQVVIAQPVAMKQVIQETDVTERRTLIDRIDNEALLTRAQVIGNQATRDLKPGIVMTGKLVDPVPLARPGQFVTVTVVSGNVKVKTVARAMEAGTFGQTIRAKNEATKDVYEVVLTGPQTAEMSTGGNERSTVAAIE